jgi:phage terminase large subunit
MTEKRKLSLDEAKLIRIWMAKPEVFFKEVLGWKPWEKQIEVLQSIRDNKETYVQSCNAAGKSYLAAGLVIWWLMTRRGKVITTAPTWRQVKDILWSKIGAMCAASPTLGLKPLQASLEIGPDWYAKGISTVQPEKLQGYHGNVLVIVDEASGVTNSAIWEALDGDLTDERHDRLLAIGNPNDPTGEFARRCKSAREFPIKGVRNNIKISAFDTPNVRTGEHVIPHLISRQWVQQKAIDWGESSPMYIVRVLGEFPRVGGDSLFPLMWLDRAFEYSTASVIDPETGEYGPQEMPDLVTAAGGMTAMGVDIGGGADHNAFAVRTGLKLLKVYGWPEDDTSEIVSDGTPSIYQWVDDHGVQLINIDALGIGQPIYNYAKKHKKGNSRYRSLRIRPFIASHAPAQERYFANMKAEAYWNWRKLLETNRLDMSQITGDMRDLIEKQANAIKYKTNAKGQIQIEEKRIMKAREGFSPDELEAVIMAFHGATKPSVDPTATREMHYGAVDSSERGHGMVRSFQYNFGE